MNPTVRTAFVAAALIIGAGALLSAQDASSPLSLSPDDIRIEQSIEGGYYLSVRAKEGIGSVLLTESTEAPDRSVNTFAFRNPEYHPENGDERRRLDGEFLPEDGRYWLVDSSPVDDEQFGRAFRIFIPYIVAFGYEWTRNGEVQVLDGTYLSIRTFGAPFADYQGGFADNPFIVRVEQPPRPEGDFMPDTVDAFEAISEEGDGVTRYSTGPEDTVNQIRALLPDEGRSIDLVLALDTTQSMRDDMPVLQEQLVPMLEEEIEGFDRVRVGFLLYRDYLEDYLVRAFDFSDDLATIQSLINRVRVAGGRDIPEAVYEALWASLENFEWEADERMIILIGDAPPHPRPRGEITAEQVFARADELSVRINTIILPQ